MRRIGLLSCSIGFAITSLSAAAAPPPTPIGGCGVVLAEAGRFVLSGNVTCPGVDAIYVTATSLVEIDLAGFTITGDLTPATAGVKLAIGAAARVHNGYIQRFSTGIETFGSANDFIVSDVVVSDNLGHGISAASLLRDMEITRVISYRNGGSGFILSPLGRVLIDSADAVANGAHGFAIIGDGARIKNATAAANGGYGFDLVGEQVVVKASRAIGNGNEGMESGILVRGARARVSSSFALGNFFEGIRVDGVGAVISRNRVTGNGFGVRDGFGIGILATAPPRGRNLSVLNDDPNQCNPLTLC